MSSLGPRGMRHPYQAFLRRARPQNVRPHAPQLWLYNFSQAAGFAPLYDLPRPSRQRDAEPIPTTDSSDLRPSLLYQRASAEIRGGLLGR